MALDVAELVAAGHLDLGQLCQHIRPEWGVLTEGIFNRGPYTYRRVLQKAEVAKGEVYRVFLDGEAGEATYSLTLGEAERDYEEVGRVSPYGEALLHLESDHLGWHGVPALSYLAVPEVRIWDCGWREPTLRPVVVPLRSVRWADLRRYLVYRVGKLAGASGVLILFHRNITTEEPSIGLAFDTRVLNYELKNHPLNTHVGWEVASDVRQRMTEIQKWLW